MISQHFLIRGHVSQCLALCGFRMFPLATCNRCFFCAEDEVKTIVDQLSFQHITTEVTIPRILAAV